MSETIITIDGDYYLDQGLGFDVSHSSATTVIILENSATATLIFGCEDENENFVAYPDGDFLDGRVINHGKGARLMVRASNISANSVTIGFYLNSN
ncbi:hypothetical protein KAR91_61905 [Candidatus Pacearchaeota archaeon]|nr:hypothetical protein [Candidatus Pacearchaeota archaeon]